MQDQGRGLQPIAFLSKKMLPAETRYPVHEQELLAIIHSLSSWKHYLSGVKFTVMTDHHSLRYFKTQPLLSGRQSRWKDVIANYDFDIEYIKGAANPVADGLSRRPDHSSALFAMLTDDSQLARADSRSLLVPVVTTSLGIDIKRAALADPKYQTELSRRHVESSRVQVKDGRLVCDGTRVYVPNDAALQTRILYECHDAAGHFGKQKTVDQIR